ncbi:MAG: ABC transporter permease subunit [Pirellulaceae bacterium]
MLRKPISRRARFGLGTASVVLMLLAYTWLSQHRQSTVRREQQEVAVMKVAELKAIENRTERQQEELDKWVTLSKSPDAVDRTVPTWSVLYHEGWVRATSEQGSFKRKEVWLINDFAATAKRLVVGLIVGILCSVVIGLLMGCFDTIDAFMLPPFTLLAKIPTTAVLPIFFVLVQINFKMYIAMILAGMIPTLAQAISASVRKDVPEELIYKAYTLGASRFELIYEVIFKQVLPRLLDAARLQIGPALVLLVAAEWMVAGEGIGYRLRLFYQRTDMTVVFVYVILLGVIGLVVDYALIWLRRWVCPWFGE